MKKRCFDVAINKSFKLKVKEQYNKISTQIDSSEDQYIFDYEDGINNDNDEIIENLDDLNDDEYIDNSDYEMDENNDKNDNNDDNENDNDYYNNNENNNLDDDNLIINIIPQILYKFASPKL
ncbi:hypothetical protein Glove_345g69 [Diversispora epigaea]|uniref:Uncharacterized protein n=1 Tax=Diversispora epigaea TaxID=1348612 RepID=A0A397HFK9_9GLOM|nr:hypothetical protein Glove_345g69 [Diversispora epigaea]